MNRRRFIQSLVVAFSLPAAPNLSFGSAASALPSAAAVPANARFWAIYMSGLHGECTPQALQNMLNIPSADAKKYLTKLIADGAIKPNPLLQSSVSNLAKVNNDRILDKAKKRLKMKASTESEVMEILEEDQSTESMDAEADLLEDITEIDPELISEDESEEAEPPASNKTVRISSRSDEGNI